MTAQAQKIAAATPQLADPRLFREQCYIDGRWTDADSGAVIEVTNPASGEVLGTIPKMGAAETRRAIAAAEKAWPAWRKLLAKERRSEEHTSELQSLMRISYAVFCLKKKNQHNIS